MNITLTLVGLFFIVAIGQIVARRSYLHDAGGSSEELRMRRQVDAIMKHLGLPEPPVSSADKLSAQVLALLTGRRYIEAIKLYRQETGETLKQSRDAIEGHRVAATTSH